MGEEKQYRYNRDSIHGLEERFKDDKSILTHEECVELIDGLFAQRLRLQERHEQELQQQRTEITRSNLKEALIMDCFLDVCKKEEHHKKLDRLIEYFGHDMRHQGMEQAKRNL